MGTYSVVGDDVMFLASRRAARDGFDQGRTLVPESDEAEKAVQHATGVTTILMQNVVQGMNMGGDKYKLNIHEHTERGDNETAKNLKGSTKSFKEIKNAQF